MLLMNTEQAQRKIVREIAEIDVTEDYELIYEGDRQALAMELEVPAQ